MCDFYYKDQQLLKGFFTSHRPPTGDSALEPTGNSRLSPQTHCAWSPKVRKLNYAAPPPQIVPGSILRIMESGRTGGAGVHRTCVTITSLA